MTTMSIIPAESIGAIEKQTEANIGLLRELIVNGRKLSNEQITGRAAFAALYGLNPVDEVNTITNAQGQTMSHSMHINGFRRKCDEQVHRELPGAKVMLEFIEFGKDRLPPGAAYAFECRLRDGSSQDAWARNMTKIGKQLREILGSNLTYKDLVEATGPSPVYSGVGIVYTRELNDYKDQNFNPIERAKKRAERNARGRRFTINAPIYDGEPSILVDQDAIEGEFQESRDDGVAETGKKPVKKTENMLLYELGDDYPKGYTRDDYDREKTEAEAQAAAVPSPEPEKSETPANDLDANGLDEDGNLEGEQGWLSPEEIAREILHGKWPNDEPKVSWDMALTVKGSKGELYIDLTKEDLSFRVGSMEKALKKPDISEAYRSETQLKLDTAKILIGLK